MIGTQAFFRIDRTARVGPGEEASDTIEGHPPPDFSRSKPFGTELLAISR